MEAALVLDYKGLYEKEKSEKEAILIAFNALRHEMDQLKKMIFGSKHERFLSESAQSNQLTLDLAVETLAASTITETITKEVTVTKTTKAGKPIVHPGRSLLPAHLRREEIILEPA